MAATFDNSVFDDGLDQGIQNISVAGNVDCHLCSAMPTTYAEATSTYSLGVKDDITISGPVDGDVSGRKVLVAAVSKEGVTADGTATHVALVDSSALVLLVAVELSAGVAVLNGEVWSANTWDIEITDPA